MSNYENLIKQLSQLETEKPNSKSKDIDLLDALEIARLINCEDKTVATVVESALGPISKAAEKFADTIKSGGRVFYIGAGTSGRLGVLDAAECPPTFGTDPAQIIGVISGGYDTLVMSKEGVEDQTASAAEDLKQQRISDKDFLIGLAASKRTPYTIAGLKFAKESRAATAFIICNKLIDNEKSLLGQFVDIIIELPVGPEIITGSTRMKSGSAQKMALNMISTSAMVLMGKTYGNLMVDLQAKSEKLAARSRKILVDMFGIKIDEAESLLANASGSVKTAIVIKKFVCNGDEALFKLKEAGGFIRRITE
ncbi:MAG: N-acetylmuramic acid 6-phosphate etherase [candidate division Zixibacteria bacterium]|nr:N-acetylmuramic acid 6-phosphate etherase [candidate division Zixibacteria bacterium]